MIRLLWHLLIFLCNFSNIKHSVPKCGIISLSAQTEPQSFVNGIYGIFDFFLFNQHTHKKEKNMMKLRFQQIHK